MTRVAMIREILESANSVYNNESAHYQQSKDALAALSKSEIEALHAFFVLGSANLLPKAAQ